MPEVRVRPRGRETVPSLRIQRGDSRRNRRPKSGLRFSARAFAGNFGPAELLEAIDRAHLWGARVHLALNTQLKQEELGPALRALEAPYGAGLDALIVADLGLATLVHGTFPELSLHASTQLNTHSSAQLEALAGLGFRRAGSQSRGDLPPRGDACQTRSLDGAGAGGRRESKGSGRGQLPGEQPRGHQGGHEDVTGTGGVHDPRRRDCPVAGGRRPAQRHSPARGDGHRGLGPLRDLG